MDRREVESRVEYYISAGQIEDAWNISNDGKNISIDAQKRLLEAMYSKIYLLPEIYELAKICLKKESQTQEFRDNLFERIIVKQLHTYCNSKTQSFNITERSIKVICHLLEMGLSAENRRWFSDFLLGFVKNACLEYNYFEPANRKKINEGFDDLFPERIFRAFKKVSILLQVVHRDGFDGETLNKVLECLRVIAPCKICLEFAERHRIPSDNPTIRKALKSCFEPENINVTAKLSNESTQFEYGGLAPYQYNRYVDANKEADPTSRGSAMLYFSRHVGEFPISFIEEIFALSVEHSLPEGHLQLKIDARTYTPFLVSKSYATVADPKLRGWLMPFFKSRLRGFGVRFEDYEVWRKMPEEYRLANPIFQ